MIASFIYFASMPVAHGQQEDPEVIVELRVLVSNNTISRLVTSETTPDEEQQPKELKEIIVRSSIKKTDDAQQTSLRVKTRNGAYSKPFTYTGTKRIIFYRGRDEVEIGQVELPAGKGSYVIFFSSKNKGYQVYPFPYGGGKALRKGQMMVANMTDKKIGIQIGTEKKILLPNASQIFKVSHFTDYQMPIAVYEKLDNKWKKGGVHTRMAVRYNTKNIAIIYNTGKEGRAALSLLPPLHWIR